jgi:hypothetical protein
MAGIARYSPALNTAAWLLDNEASPNSGASLRS